MCPIPEEVAVRMKAAARERNRHYLRPFIAHLSQQCVVGYTYGNDWVYDAIVAVGDTVEDAVAQACRD